MQHPEPRLGCNGPSQVPDAAAIPPDTDFSLMYRFLGGLFDADSSLDHARVLDKVQRYTWGTLTPAFCTTI